MKRKGLPTNRCTGLIKPASELFTVVAIESKKLQLKDERTRIFQ
jgi:hypothetical protein